MVVFNNTLLGQTFASNWRTIIRVVANVHQVQGKVASCNTVYCSRIYQNNAGKYVFTQMTVEETVQLALENLPIVKNVCDHKDPEICKRLTAKEDSQMG
jgi:hypothetical protein